MESKYLTLEFVLGDYRCEQELFPAAVKVCGLWYKLDGQPGRLVHVPVETAADALGIAAPPDSPGLEATWGRVPLAARETLLTGPNAKVAVGALIVVDNGYGQPVRIAQLAEPLLLGRKDVHVPILDFEKALVATAGGFGAGISQVTSEEVVRHARERADGLGDRGGDSRRSETGNGELAKGAKVKTKVLRALSLTLAAAVKNLQEIHAYAAENLPGDDALPAMPPTSERKPEAIPEFVEAIRSVCASTIQIRSYATVKLPGRTDCPKALKYAGKLDHRGGSASGIARLASAVMVGLNESGYSVSSLRPTIAAALREQTQDLR